MDSKKDIIIFHVPESVNETKVTSSIEKIVGPDAKFEIQILNDTKNSTITEKYNHFKISFKESEIGISFFSVLLEFIFLLCVFLYIAKKIVEKYNINLEGKDYKVSYYNDKNRQTPVYEFIVIVNNFKGTEEELKSLFSSVGKVKSIGFNINGVSCLQIIFIYESSYLFIYLILSSYNIRR